MRSSGRTIVSRTRERMPSVRRRRRGRFVRALPAAPAVRSFFRLEVVVVIRFSREIVGAAAFGRAESPAVPRAVRAVGTEVAVADVALLETHRLLGPATAHANPLALLGHRNIFARPVFAEGCRLTLTVTTGPPTIPIPSPGGVAQMVRAGVS